MRSDDVEIGLGIGDAFAVELAEFALSALAAQLGRRAENAVAGRIADEVDGLARCDRGALQHGKLRLPVLVIDEQTYAAPVRFRRHAGNAAQILGGLAGLFARKSAGDPIGAVTFRRCRHRERAVRDQGADQDRTGDEADGSNPVTSSLMETRLSVHLAMPGPYPQLFNVHSAPRLRDY